jgi:excisionase family DNA binding protein
MIKPATTTPPAMLDVREVAALLKCSARTVTRLEETGAMPPAVRLGRLCRWNRAAIEAWIADNCPAVNAAESE